MGKQGQKTARDGLLEGFFAFPTKKRGSGKLGGGSGKKGGGREGGVGGREGGVGRWPPPLASGRPTSRWGRGGQSVGGEGVPKGGVGHTGHIVSALFARENPSPSLRPPHPESLGSGEASRPKASIGWCGGGGVGGQRLHLAKSVLGGQSGEGRAKSPPPVPFWPVGGQWGLPGWPVGGQ